MSDTPKTALTPEDLESCPFCGNTEHLDIEHKEWNDGTDLYTVHCSCGSEGTTACTPVAAAEAWNRRASQPLSGQQREEPAICGESPVPIDADLVGCGEPIWTEAEVYRCTDCGVPFHRACAIRHFATDTPEHAQEVFAEQLRRLESASPVAMPEEGKAVASHAEEVQERASADLAEELRDMADEIASENWGASWSFQQYAVVMRDAAAALEAAPSQSETRQPCIGKNPSCPCQDGDACHYRDAADGTKGWPIPPAPDVLAMAEEALKHARQFIKNGVEYGYILMPDPDTPDSAHDTLPRIEAALARLATHTQEGGQIK